MSSDPSHRKDPARHRRLAPVLVLLAAVALAGPLPSASAAGPLPEVSVDTVATNVGAATSRLPSADTARTARETVEQAPDHALQGGTDVVRQAQHVAAGATGTRSAPPTPPASHPRPRSKVAQRHSPPHRSQRARHTSDGGSVKRPAATRERGERTPQTIFDAQPRTSSSPHAAPESSLRDHLPVPAPTPVSHGAAASPASGTALAVGLLIALLLVPPVARRRLRLTSAPLGSTLLLLAIERPD
jgi:hypothetical protein